MTTKRNISNSNSKSNSNNDSNNNDSRFYMLPSPLNSQFSDLCTKVFGLVFPADASISTPFPSNFSPTLVNFGQPIHTAGKEDKPLGPGCHLIALLDVLVWPKFMEFNFRFKSLYKNKLRGWA